MKDSDELANYKLESGHTIHMVKTGPAAAAPATTSNSAPTATANPPTSTTAPPQTPFAAAMPGQMNLPFGFPFPGQPASPTGAAGANPMAGLMNDPNILASVSAMMSNPQMMDMMIAMNPQLGAMLTPEMRQMMASDQFRQMMANPMMLQQLMSMQGGMGGAGMPSMFGNMPNLSGMNFGGAAAPQQPRQPVANPEETYQAQLQQLRDMGFYSASENVQALQATFGNVEAAVEYLLSRSFR